ncbi:MAG: hypothetical protein ACLS7Z_00490 [Christensenellales bacterium]
MYILHHSVGAQPIRSRPVDEIAAEAQSLAEAELPGGCADGHPPTSYGATQGRHDAARCDSRGATCRESRGCGSLMEPVVVTPDFVGDQGMPKVCHQFHLALQSGSDTVLARMHRRYTSGEF